MNGKLEFSGVKAVVFDVFGTLVEITEKRKPYSKLLQLLRDSGREPKDDDASRLMSSNVGLLGATQLFDVDIPPSALAKLELDLYAELQSIKLFPDTLSALTRLKTAGYKIGLCSNLAAPYAVPIKLLVPFELNAYTWSFEIGVIKPSPAIYQNACAALDCLPHETIMIGDTLEADYHGARRAGMHGLHLARQGGSPVKECIGSLADIFARLGLHDKE